MQKKLSICLGYYFIFIVIIYGQSKDSYYNYQIIKDKENKTKKMVNRIGISINRDFKDTLLIFFNNKFIGKFYFETNYSIEEAGAINVYLDLGIIEIINDDRKEKKVQIKTDKNCNKNVLKIFNLNCTQCINISLDCYYKYIDIYRYKGKYWQIKYNNDEIIGIE